MSNSQSVVPSVGQSTPASVAPVAVTQKPIAKKADEKTKVVKPTMSLIELISSGFKMSSVKKVKGAELIKLENGKRALFAVTRPKVLSSGRTVVNLRLYAMDEKAKAEKNLTKDE